MAHFPYISMNSNECQSISEDLDSYCEDTIYNIPNDSQHSDFNQIVTDETHWHTLCNSPRDRENSPFVFCPQTGMFKIQKFIINNPPPISQSL